MRVRSNARHLPHGVAALLSEPAALEQWTQEALGHLTQGLLSGDRQPDIAAIGAYLRSLHLPACGEHLTASHRIRFLVFSTFSDPNKVVAPFFSNALSLSL